MKRYDVKGWDSMKRYDVKGWFRYGNNEKDYQHAEIVAENEQMVITLFRDLYKENFFAIDIKLVS